MVHTHENPNKQVLATVPPLQRFAHVQCILCQENRRATSCHEPCMGGMAARVSDQLHEGAQSAQTITVGCAGDVVCHTQQARAMHDVLRSLSVLDGSELCRVCFTTILQVTSGCCRLLP